MPGRLSEAKVKRLTKQLYNPLGDNQSELGNVSDHADSIRRDRNNSRLDSKWSFYLPLDTECWDC